MGKIINTVKSVSGKLIETFRPKNGPTMDIHKANERISELEKELENKPVSNSLLTPIDIEAFKSEYESKHSLQIETLKNEYELKLVDALKQVNEAKQSSNKQAWKTLATLGVEPDLIPSMTPQEYLTKNNGVTVVNLLDRKK